MPYPSRAARTGLAAVFAFGALLMPAAAQHSGALKAGDGSARGTITVTPAPKGVLLKVEATGLSPGWHGIHFHEKGDCTGPAFTSAGAHVHGAAATVVHGLLNPNANDSGDLPNIFAGADGKATAEIYSTLTTVMPGGSLPALLDADGAAVVIHASPDDHSTQPIGGAGARVACAVIGK